MADRRKKSAEKRLQIEQMMMTGEPEPLISAAPIANNLFEWRFVLEGPEDSPYADGMFMGRLLFPLDYPFRSPALTMLTPTGRFETGTNIQLSDVWCPTRSIATSLSLFLQLMISDENAIGTVVATSEERRMLAETSRQFNMRDAHFRNLFPDLVARITGIPVPIPEDAVIVIPPPGVILPQPAHAALPANVVGDAVPDGNPGAGELVEVEPMFAGFVGGLPAAVDPILQDVEAVMEDILAQLDAVDAELRAVQQDMQNLPE